MSAEAIIGSMTLGFLPSFAWLVFFLHEDSDWEPKRVIAITFMVGCAFAFITLAVQYLLQDIFAGANVSQISFLALTIFAATEECGKFLAARIASGNDPDFDIPIDAMVYMVTAALGFALVENLGVLGSIVSQTASLGDIIRTLSSRFIGATLLHALSSAFVGYYWAKSIRAFKDWRLLVLGIAIATLFHASFNYLIWNYGEGFYPLLFLLAAGLLVLGDFEKLRGERV